MSFETLCFLEIQLCQIAVQPLSPSLIKHSFWRIFLVTWKSFCWLCLANMVHLLQAKFELQKRPLPHLLQRDHPPRGCLELHIEFVGSLTTSGPLGWRKGAIFLWWKKVSLVVGSQWILDIYLIVNIYFDLSKNGRGVTCTLKQDNSRGGSWRVQPGTFPHTVRPVLVGVVYTRIRTLVFLNSLVVDLSLCQSEVNYRGWWWLIDCNTQALYCSQTLKNICNFAINVTVTDKQKWSLINGLASSIGRLFVHYDPSGLVRWRFASDKVW